MIIMGVYPVQTVKLGDEDIITRRNLDLIPLLNLENMFIDNLMRESLHYYASRGLPISLTALSSEDDQTPLIKKAEC